MAKLRVWIHYGPRIYSELFSTLLSSVQGVEILDYEHPVIYDEHQNEVDGYDEIDLVVFSLDTLGEPDLGQIGNLFPGAKLIAFSPTGDFGLKRQPGGQTWDEVSPYGVFELLAEVQAQARANEN